MAEVPVIVDDELEVDGQVELVLNKLVLVVGIGIIVNLCVYVRLQDILR